LLAAEWEEGVKADITVLGKSLSGGFYPVSATLTSHEVMDCIRPGEHGSTFGGNPLACAIGQAALDVVFEEGMVENSLEMGEYLKNEIADIVSGKEFVTDLRGRGLFVGLE
jgi:ornithine--oxo-acid transaminase